MGSQFINIPAASWQSPVPSVSYLPADGNNIGDARVTQDTSTIYIWTGSSWTPVSGGGGGGGVTNVTASAPLSSSGGTTPNLTIATASASQTGVLSSTDWSTFNGVTTKAPTASPTFTGSVKFGNYHVEPSQSTVSVTGSSTSIDLSAASGFIVSLSASTTVSFVNPQTGGAYALEIVQGASAYTVTWQAGVKWPGGTAPVISVANGAIDKVSLYYDGAIYLGTYGQAFS